MNTLTNKWVHCSKDNNNPEDFNELDDNLMKIKQVPYLYLNMFVLRIGIIYSNNFYHKIAYRKFIKDKWMWFDINTDDIIKDNDVLAWYMLPTDF